MAISAVCRCSGPAVARESSRAVGWGAGAVRSREQRGGTGAKRRRAWSGSAPWHLAVRHGARAAGLGTSRAEREGSGVSGETPGEQRREGRGAPCRPWARRLARTRQGSLRGHGRFLDCISFDRRGIRAERRPEYHPLEVCTSLRPSVYYNVGGGSCPPLRSFRCVAFGRLIQHDAAGSSLDCLCRPFVAFAHRSTLG